MKTFFYLNNKIMKTNKFISFRNLCCIVLCAVLCTACPPDTCKNAKLRIEENSLEFLGAGGSASVDVASNVELKVSCEETWCSVSPKTAIGNVTLNVTVQRNSTAMPRVAKITVQSVDCVISKEIVVIQREGQPVGPDCDLNGNCLNVTPVDLNFEQSGSNKTVAVTSNVSWTAMSDQQWCTVSPASSSNNETVNINVAENTGVGSRVAIVTIRDNVHSLSKDITVTQAGNEPAIAVSPETKEVGTAASSFEVNVTANVSWQVASDQSWCTVSPATGNGNGKVTVSIAAYTGATSRTAKLTVSNSTYGLSKTVMVTQSNAPQYDIYVAGVNKDGFATYWKNGVAFVNQNLKDIYRGIAVNENGDVYTSTWHNGYYKNNGIKVEINGSITSIAVFNGNVYATSTTYSTTNIAYYWLNGTPTTLTSGWGISAKSIFVSNGDVYVAGVGGYSAVYWKNGSMVTLGGSSNNTNNWAEAYSIFVSGNDVYVGGFHNNSVNQSYTSYWKNGNGFYLGKTGTGNNIPFVKDIKVSSNGDLHKAGYHFEDGNWHIKYWKNNVESFKYNIGMSSESSSPRFRNDYNIMLAFADNDVYMVEIQLSSSGFGTSKYMINGKLENFTNDDGAVAAAIVVKNR